VIRIMLALLLVLAAGLPAATAQEPKRGGVLRVGLYDEPAGLDPTLAGDPIGIRVRNHVMERLVDLDADLAIKPMLARSWTVSPDGKTYTFALRPGVKFHNGDELTAEDADLVVLAALGVAAFWVVQRVERKAIPWHVSVRLDQPTVTG